MTPKFNVIKDDFDFLDEWDDKYRFVIDLGKGYDALPAELRIDTLKVAGCASQVWLHLRNEDGILRFRGASDALIVSGLIAILSSLYDEHPIKGAKAIDAQGAFTLLGLDQHLSAQRSNGLYAMIAKIKDFLNDNT